MKCRLNLLMLCLSLVAFRAAATPPGRIAITHVGVIDVREGTVEADMTVLIEGTKITAILPSKSMESLPPKDTRVIDGRGKFLLPGFWDMHVHTDAEDRFLRLLLANGITGIRDMAGDAAKLTDARRRINSGELAGPRLVFAGTMLEGPPSEANEESWIIHSPEEARRAVQRLADLHVDFIKVHDGLSREDILAIAATSKEKGLPFVGHVQASITPGEASDLGQKSIEHLEFVPKACHALFEAPVANAPQNVPPDCDPQALDSLLRRFARNGTWLDPTVQSFRYFAPKQWDSIFAEFTRLVTLIRRNRVSILAGTDSSTFLEDKGDPPGKSLHDELALLVDAGFTKAEALRAATLNPAVFLGISDLLGTVEAGKTASLVLLEANPLQDIRNSKRIAAVIFEGRYLDRQMLDRMLSENCSQCQKTGAEPRAPTSSPTSLGLI
jgi:imidazolonepropionase-like amidohydrolase